jgi:hypothetical protein
MSTTSDKPYQHRMRRLRVRAQLRYERRRRRCTHLWNAFREFYGKQPKLGSHFWFKDGWTPGGRCWCYEDALHLEDQALILLTRLTHVVHAARHETDA